jgi:hypothetical protein
METRRAILLAVVAAGALMLGEGAAAGCGDKFVVLGRGARFGRVNASRFPARILIYGAPGSRMPAAEREYRIESTLKQAGHKPAFVQNSGDLEKALGSRKYDLVLADASDKASLERAVRAASSDATVIPVVYNPTSAELADAEKRYSCLVKASRKDNDLLSVIDETMLSKSRGTAANCLKAR